MSKKFDIISFVLMAILLIVLFAVVFSYFSKASSSLQNVNSSLNMADNLISSGDNSLLIASSNNPSSGSDTKPQSIINLNPNGTIDKDPNESNSGETDINTHKSGEQTDLPSHIEQNSGESISSGETSGEVEHAPSNNNFPINPNDKNVEDENPNSVIMTSANDISSSDKKKVLQELDQTLMELLDVVDTVKTVDETRLIVDESEVQEWKSYLYA